MSVYRTVEGIELARHQTQREKMAPSPLPVSQSQASKTHIASLVTKDLADLQLTLTGPSAYYKFIQLIRYIKWWIHILVIMWNKV